VVTVIIYCDTVLFGTFSFVTRPHVGDVLIVGTRTFLVQRVEMRAGENSIRAICSEF